MRGRDGKRVKEGVVEKMKGRNTKDGVREGITKGEREG